MCVVCVRNRRIKAAIKFLLYCAHTSRIGKSTRATCVSEIETCLIERHNNTVDIEREKNSVDRHHTICCCCHNNVCITALFVLFFSTRQCSCPYRLISVGKFCCTCGEEKVEKKTDWNKVFKFSAFANWTLWTAATWLNFMRACIIHARVCVCTLQSIIANVRCVCANTHANIRPHAKHLASCAATHANWNQSNTTLYWH